MRPNFRNDWRAAVTAVVFLFSSQAFSADAAHTVIQKGRSFHPRDVTIGRDESLTFTNNDNFIHQIYVEGLFDSAEQSPGENLKESFPRTGTFQVRCHIHPTMRMTVVVK